MTLKEKFLKNKMLTNGEVKIAEEFAIGFLNWYKIHGKWITKHLEDFELLDLYKKEKGL
jgi:hypothetical protein